tara:strand:- start:238 stop:465 length:228 start_codon:yes stop_codon:yes gene_type:complete
MKTFKVYENSEYLGQIHGPKTSSIEDAEKILKMSDLDLPKTYQISVGERTSKGFLVPMTAKLDEYSSVPITGWYI